MATFLRTIGFPMSAALSALICAPAMVSAQREQPELTDQAIVDHVEDEMLMDRGVVSSKIEVSAADGIVTLDGTVNNILAKDRAARVAETVRGVRAVVNQVEVTPSVGRSDAAIEADVEEAIAQNPATERFDATVSVTDGVVTLGGQVDSYQEQQLLKKVAKGVRGVLEVDDQISISYDSQRTDVEIREEIEQALRWSLYIDSALVAVSVNEGRVDLSGTVGSAAEKTRAAATAWVAGVESVDDSDLTVARWARDDDLRAGKFTTKPDGAVLEAAADALIYDPRVNSTNVNVDVTGGTATLRGEVASLSAKNAAEQTVRNTVGVWRVRNRLDVTPEGVLSDSEVGERIDEAVERDPYLERFDITSAVIDGTAYLYGTVDSWFEKNRAETVASRVTGVLDVVNNLKTDYQGAYTYDPYVDESYVEPGFWAEYERRSPLESDSDLRESIQSELWWSPYVDSDEVTVIVDDGVATLTGVVGSWSERRYAVENAYEGGATLVDNDLTVDYDQ